MQQVISFQQAQTKHFQNLGIKFKKAMILAQIHVFINEAESHRKELYKSYYEAFNANKRDEMVNLSREITEAGGRLSAFRKCENLIAINI